MKKFFDIETKGEAILVVALMIGAIIGLIIACSMPELVV